MSIKRPQYPPLSTFECVMRKNVTNEQMFDELKWKEKEIRTVYINFYEAKMKMA